MSLDSSPSTEERIEKSSEETTTGDLRTLMGSPVDIEEPLLVDDGVFDAEQPSVPIYKSISLKTGLAAVASLFIILPILVLFAGSVMSDSSKDKTTASTRSKDIEVEETEEEKALRESEEQNATLKRQLALQQQDFAAAELEEQPQLGEAALDAESPTTLETVSNPADIQASRPIPAATPPQVVSRPVPRAVPTTSLPAPTAPLPAPRPRSQPRPYVAPIQSTPTATTSVATTPTRVVTVDLSELSNNGSYGSLPQSNTDMFTETPNNVAMSLPTTDVGIGGSVVARASTIPVTINPVKAIEAIATSNAVKEQQPEKGKTRPLPQVMQDFSKQSAPISNSYLASNPTQSTYQTLLANQTETPVVELAASYEEERALILGDVSPPLEIDRTPAIIPPGTIAEGQLSQAITWTSDMTSIRGMITLSSPLMSSGYEVLPAGTDIMVEVARVSESGAVELRPTAIVLSQESPLQLAISPDAVQILASDGGYPIAHIKNGSEAALRRIDRQQAFLGALSGAGQFINRPDSESGFLGAGGSSYNRDYGDGGSVWAAIVGGAADEVLNGRSQRLAAQAALIAERPPIWSLPSGMEVQIFVSQEVQL